MYKSVFDGWKTIAKSEGIGGVFTGVGPTAIGYSLQGAGKYGLYEVFKYRYANLVGEENAHKYRTLLYLGASASAEFFADILLCPMEALKVKMQTTVPPFARTTGEGFKKIISTEGYLGFYKGIVPLWGRQVINESMRIVVCDNNYLYRCLILWLNLHPLKGPSNSFIKRSYPNPSQNTTSFSR